jgi:hypothetical protein
MAASVALSFGSAKASAEYGMRVPERFTARSAASISSMAPASR